VATEHLLAGISAAPVAVLQHEEMETRADGSSDAIE
jgi:hypothetical protein